MKAAALCVLISVFLVSFVGCMEAWVTKNQIQNFDMKQQQADISKAFAAISNVFVDRGFEIKSSNKDAGLISTEYKKIASVGDNPPFDMYLRISAVVRDIGEGRVSVKLSPMTKQQNRLNAAAFTEEELVYFTGDAKYLGMIKSMKEGSGWRYTAITEFNNVVHDVATALKVSDLDILKNVTTTQYNAFDADKL